MKTPPAVIGTRVRIRKDSKYASQHDGVGVIYQPSREHPLNVGVEWPDGYTNSYSTEHDLELAEPATTLNRRRGMRKEKL